MSGCIKWAGLIMLLGGFLIAAYGFLATGGAVAETVPNPAAASDATILGVGIGASLSLSVFLCIGVPMILCGLIAYFVGNSGQQKDQEIKMQRDALDREVELDQKHK